MSLAKNNYLDEIKPFSEGISALAFCMTEEDFEDACEVGSDARDFDFNVSCDDY